LNTAVFESFRADNGGWSACFGLPVATWFAYSLDEVLPAIHWAEQSALDGYWVAVALSYEAAPAFDHVLRVHTREAFPLACILIFDSIDSCAVPLADSQDAYQTSAWLPQITYDKYHRDVRRILKYITVGDTYQVNYSFPLRCEFTGSSWDWYRDLCSAQQAGFCAYLDLGRYHLLSLSPELFFQRSGNRLVTRPMKGTMPRGRWLEEDDTKAKELRASQKNQAENVMIADLLRNDLGKISVPGSVKLTSLFGLEKYDTLWQMTSTIESECQAGLKLTDIFRALFPCGSITGAPKIRTMEIIHEVETLTRDIYTGAIGFLKPGGDCIFNVAIRTILLDTQTGQATFGIGGGITSDSTPAAEYEEAVLKASFLNRKRPQFRLLETMLLEDGEYFLLDRHLKRMVASARYFDFVWDEGTAVSLLEALRARYETGIWKVRLLAARNGGLDTEVEALAPASNSEMRVTLASEPVDCANPFMFHKTTNRSVYEDARHAQADYDDVILWNPNNEVTESTVANIVVQLDSVKWTPPRTSGLLSGTFRDELLQKGEIRERLIYKEELCRAESLWLINSVRRWMPVILAQ
jgi:para-aminobenzoate synthetase/4-amino-4-deoxychorismate lyase